MKDLTIEIDALAVVGKSSKLKHYFDNKEIKYFQIKRNSFIKLAKIIDENHIDIVHFHWTKDLPTVVLAKIFSKTKPKIVQTRHMHMTRFKSDFYHKFLYKNVNAIIAVTNLVKEQLEKFIPKEIRPNIIKSYIGVRDFKPIDSKRKDELKNKLGLKDEFIVSIVGRIEEAKGQYKVLEAVERLRQNGENIKALIVGHSMEESYLKDLKSRYKDDIFTGFVDNTNEYMQISNCLVLATKKETFGLVLVEAMRCGICVIANNKGGPLEIIEDGKSGLLFDGEKQDDLKEKIYLCMKDEALLKSLAINGKNRASEIFDEVKQFNEVKGILKSI
ncbi:glycosyltransferase, family 1 [Campylobacter blaseri]|nr:glycosyltransferase, family 1 [Campylobacter blaseri]